MAPAGLAGGLLVAAVALAAVWRTTPGSDA